MYSSMTHIKENSLRTEEKTQITHDCSQNSVCASFVVLCGLAASLLESHSFKHSVTDSLSESTVSLVCSSADCHCSETWCCSKVTCLMGPLYWYYIKQASYIFLSVPPCLLLQDSDEMYFLNVFFCGSCKRLGYLFEKAVFKCETVPFLSVF